METQRINFISSLDYALHVPQTVLETLPHNEVGIFLVPDEMSGTAEFSKAYGIELDDCANTIVIQYRKGGVERYAAVVSLGSRRLDINGAVKSGLGAQRLSFAKREIAVGLTGMEYGAITAFGVPEDWPILIDEVVLSRREIVAGAGVRTAKLLISPGLLTRLPNAQVGVFSTLRE